jgi:Zinc finger, C2H2 type
MDSKFTCERCHYSTNVKCHLIDHLKKKNECQTIHSSISREDIINRLQGLSEKKHTCNICNKMFSYKRNLQRHIKTQHNTVGETTNNTQNYTDCFNTNCHNTTNNTNITNNFNISPVINIDLRPFGDEIVDYLMENDKFLSLCVKSIKASGVPNMFDAIWLNDDIPQNKNIKFKTIRHPSLVKIYTNDGWKETEAENPLNICIDKILNILRQQTDKLYTEGKEVISDGFTKDEVLEQRTDSINNIKSKKRNSGYSQIKSNIMINLKNATKESGS